MGHYDDTYIKTLLITLTNSALLITDYTKNLFYFKMSLLSTVNKKLESLIAGKEVSNYK